MKMREKKYGYTGKTRKWFGREFRQIVALCDVSTTVHKGDIGGYIEYDRNLSHRGACWVDADCIIGGGVCVMGTAQIHSTDIVVKDSDYIQICGWSEINNCSFDVSTGDHISISDSIMCDTYLSGECVVMRSTICRSEIIKSCIAESIIADSDIADSVIFSRRYHNDTEECLFS